MTLAQTDAVLAERLATARARIAALVAERLDELTDTRLMIRDRLAEMVAGIAPEPEAIDRTAERLKQLRDELEAAERVAARYPELADSSLRKREAIAAEISKLERT